MVKTKITHNDGTKKKYESDAVFGAAITEASNGTHFNLYICGNMDALEACTAATDLIREMDDMFDLHGKFISALILRLIADGYEPKDAD